MIFIMMLDYECVPTCSGYRYSRQQGMLTCYSLLILDTWHQRCMILTWGGNRYSYLIGPWGSEIGHPE